MVGKDGQGLALQGVPDEEVFFRETRREKKRKRKGKVKEGGRGWIRVERQSSLDWNDKSCQRSHQLVSISFSTTDVLFGISNTRSPHTIKCPESAHQPRCLLFTQADNGPSLRVL